MGGQPTVSDQCAHEPYLRLCTTREPNYYWDVNWLARNEGLWFVTIQPIPHPGVISQMLDVAKQLGICTSKLRGVEHRGCRYEGAKHKYGW